MTTLSILLATGATYLVLRYAHGIYRMLGRRRAHSHKSVCGFRGGDSRAVHHTGRKGGVWLGDARAGILPAFFRQACRKARAGAGHTVLHDRATLADDPAVL